MNCPEIEFIFILVTLWNGQPMPNDITNTRFYISHRECLAAAERSQQKQRARMGASNSLVGPITVRCDGVLRGEKPPAKGD
jgi:hypothetical protein